VVGGETDLRGSASLAVRSVLAATRAELRKLEPVRVVAAVLPRDVVALLALRAGESDLWTNIRSLGGHVPTPSASRPSVWCTLTAHVAVARAGLEPATSRL
jgi:hypothetical protein